jgi:hypothetical protein
MQFFIELIMFTGSQLSFVFTQSKLPAGRFGNTGFANAEMLFGETVFPEF